MTDGAYPDRLTQLRAKWESDPTSRVFLQLAEEYRHGGRVKEALAVLEKGLKEHPGYLSALVAKGRCHLELGDGGGARTVLERVVKQDPTQMVANKLLVRAYLETGEPAKAQERLDLYILLNDSDPEIEELRRRIKSMDRPAAPAEEPRHMDADPFSLDPPAPRREAAADVFDMRLAPPPAPRRDRDDIFDMDGPRASPAASAPIVPPAAVSVPAVATPQGMEPAERTDPSDLLFPGLASQESRQRYLEGLGAEGLFAFAEAAPAAPREAVEEVKEKEVVAEEEDLWGEETRPGVLPAPIEPAPIEPAVAWQAEPLATATLGDLYLRQGHRAEAESIFQEVLQKEPDNAAARAGLAQLAEAEPREPGGETPLLDARRLLAGFQPAPGRTGGTGVTARKIFLLNGYLARLRRGSARNVS